MIKQRLPKQAIALSLLLSLACSPALAIDVGDVPQILTQNLNYVADIMETIAIMLGLGLFIGGMFQLKRYGEMRTMMSSQTSIAGPLMMLLSGVALLCSPLMIGTLLVSFWGTAGASDLPYEGSTATGWSEFIPPILMLVRLVGVFSFMRGFVTAARIGSGHTQPGTIGKVLIYIFAGILSVHIMGTIKLIESFFGINMT
ncbi:MAG: type IV secretion protein IcmC [Proteobacteria bacterium]|nr:type IV secretion protein IcmC [Pseudomonadota bacterium]